MKESATSVKIEGMAYTYMYVGSLIGLYGLYLRIADRGKALTVQRLVYIHTYIHTRNSRIRNNVYPLLAKPCYAGFDGALNRDQDRCTMQ